MKLEVSASQSKAVSGRSVRFGFAVGRRFFGLFTLSLTVIPLMFVSSKFGWLLASWNALVVIIFVMDARKLPSPDLIRIERLFNGEFRQLQQRAVTLRIENRSQEPLWLAIQDDVAVANLLAKKLRRGAVSIVDLRQVQRRREWPTALIQHIQAFIHRHVVTGCEASNKSSLPRSREAIGLSEV